jgi:transcriptional regulator with GAF, ATPase, and Fis domain
MFANLRLHLHRISSRRLIRRERLDPVRIDTTLRFFVEHLPELLHAECCNIYIYDPVAAKAWVEVGTGLDAGALAVPTKSTFVGEVIASGEPRIANDPTSLLSVASERGALRGLVIRNAVGVPIRSRYHDEVIGAIELLNKIGDGGFVAADIAPLEEATEIIQDLVDSVFLAQKVYGAADATLAESRYAIEVMAGFILLGSIVTLLLMAAWEGIPVINDALDPSLLPFMPERAR